MRRLRLLPRADRDLDGAADGYAEAGGIELGLRFLSTAEATWAQLREHPFIGRECTWLSERLRGVRQTMLRTPFHVYQVFYRVNDDVVTVLRVLHGARDLAAILLEAQGE